MSSSFEKRRADLYPVPISPDRSAPNERFPSVFIFHSGNKEHYHGFSSTLHWLCCSPPDSPASFMMAPLRALTRLCDNHNRQHSRPHARGPQLDSICEGCQRCNPEFARRFVAYAQACTVLHLLTYRCWMRRPLQGYRNAWQGKGSPACPYPPMFSKQPTLRGFSVEAAAGRLAYKTHTS